MCKAMYVWLHDKTTSHGNMKYDFVMHNSLAIFSEYVIDVILLLVSFAITPHTAQITVKRVEVSRR